MRHGMKHGVRVDLRRVKQSRRHRAVVCHRLRYRCCKSIRMNQTGQHNMPEVVWQTITKITVVLHQSRCHTRYAAPRMLWETLYSNTSPTVFSCAPCRTLPRSSPPASLPPPAAGISG